MINKIKTMPWSSLTTADARALAVDGVQPSWRACPATPEDVAAVLRAATENGLAVSPRGAATNIDLGMPPGRLDLILDTTALAGLVAYRPADLTAVALAGTPLASLQETFAREGQWLPLDPPFAAHATLGGVLATNDAGPHRLRYGTARNLVLGMQVAYSDGRLARSGARVVKSVAGYNVHKLHIGALGTLGVIVEAALRLHPLPRARSAALCRVDRPDQAAILVDMLLRLPAGLGALELLNSTAAERVFRQAGHAFDGVTGDTLVVLCQGYPAAVRRKELEVRQAAKEAGSAIEAIVADVESVSRFADALASAPESDTPADLVLSLGVPPARTVEAATRLESLVVAETPAARVIAHAGNGLGLAVAPVAPARVASLVSVARTLATEYGGHLVVRKCPPEAKRALDLWGPVMAPHLMRRLKEALDPTGTLNPGRFAGGI